MVIELITALANISLTLSLVVAIIFGLAQVKAAARDRRERLTLETLRNFQTREFAELMNYIVSHDLPETMRDVRKLPIEEQVMFTQLAQGMESLGLLVAENLIDLDLVDKTLGSFVSSSWKKYENIFLAVRAEDPFIGEYFQWLSEQVDHRLKENPRKPMYKFLG